MSFELYAFFGFISVRLLKQEPLRKKFTDRSNSDYSFGRSYQMTVLLCIFFFIDVNSAKGL